MKILIVYKQNRSFVHEDISLLKKHFSVDSCQWTGIKSIYTIWKKARQADIIYIWFASYHAFITTLLTRKPKIVITGGYDVAGEKEINYGLMLHPIWRRMVKFTIKRAEKIISVSKHNKKDLEEHLGITDSVVIYNSVDSKKFYPKGNKNKKLVITVGFIKPETWIRKGFSKFVEVAKITPDYQFVAIGKIDDKLKEKVSEIERTIPNITFTGFVPDEELLHWYQKAKVYCQLSYYESYGIAPAEAMLCECIPIVTNRAALPEVVGDVGYKVPYGNINQIQNSIEQASKSSEGKKSRKRIKETFSISRRETSIKKFLEKFNE